MVGWKMSKITHPDRRHFPQEIMIVGENMPTCHYCDSRLQEVFGTETGSSREEVCIGCGQHYICEDELQEDVDEADRQEEEEKEERAALLTAERDANYPTFGSF
jgi:hypothetical protein